MASMAFMCSSLYSFWCESFEIQPMGMEPVKFGPWYRRDTVVQEIGIGGGDPYYRTVNTCVLLEDEYSIDWDSKWKTARAFGVLAPLWGGLLTVVLWFAPCLYFLSAAQWQAVALNFSVIATLFQGLTFLIFQSSLCDDPSELLLFWSAAVPGETDGCQWEGGSTANVFSISLWFLTGVAMMAVGVPERPPRPPPETQTVTYQKTTNPDGTTTVAEVAVVKGTALPANQADAVATGDDLEKE